MELTEKEEKFYEVLERLVPSYTMGTDNVLLDILEIILSSENWVAGDKGVGAGTWIKVPTGRGFRMYFAKKTRASRGNELPVAAASKLVRKLLSEKSDRTKVMDLKEFYGENLFLAVVESELNKADQLRYDMIMKVLKVFTQKSGYYPRFVTIRTKKRESTYLLPFQYDLASDNILQLFGYVGKSPAVTFTQHFEVAGVADQVFYLQCRGYSKQAALVAVNKQGGFLDVDEIAILDG